MPPRTHTKQFSCSTLSLLLCTFFCAFNTCVSCITFFLGLAASHSSKDPPSSLRGLAASHSSKDPPSLAYWLFASPQLISVRWCCRGRAKRENDCFALFAMTDKSNCKLTSMVLRIMIDFVSLVDLMIRHGFSWELSSLWSSRSLLVSAFDLSVFVCSLCRRSSSNQKGAFSFGKRHWESMP